MRKGFFLTVMIFSLSACTTTSAPAPVQPPVASKCVGDLNGDGTVTIEELKAVTEGRQGNAAVNAGADVNGDGKIDDVEYFFVVDNVTGCKHKK